MSCEFRLLDYNYLFDSTVTVSASSEDAAFPVSNLSQFTRSKVWRSSGIASAEYITIDLITTNPIDTVAILFDPMDGSRLSSSAVLTIQADASPSFLTTPVNQTLTYDGTNGTYSHFFTSNQNYRYWRLKIEDSLNANGFVEIPKLFIGKATQLTQGPEMGFAVSYEDKSKTNETEYGHRYTDLYPIRKTCEFSYVALSDSDTETLTTMYQRLGRSTPLLACLDATEEMFDKDRFMFYGFFDGSLDIKQRFASYFDVSLKIKECI